MLRYASQGYKAIKATGGGCRDWVLKHTRVSRPCSLDSLVALRDLSLYGAYSNLGEEEYSCLRPGEHFFNINYDKELNRISIKKMQFAVLYIYIYPRYMQESCLACASIPSPEGIYTASVVLVVVHVQ